MFGFFEKAEPEQDKTVFSKRTKKSHLTHVKGTLYHKFGCSMKLETNENIEKCKSILANVEKPQADPRGRRKKAAACSSQQRTSGTDSFTLSFLSV